MECNTCHASNPEQVRSSLLCGYLPESKRRRVGNAVLVPGASVNDPTVCPGYSCSDRRVHEIAEAWGWWKRGQLQLRCPEPSEILMDLISLFNGAMGGAQSYFMEQRKPTK